MLKKITISNYRSFYDEAVLDFTVYHDAAKENECRFLKKINNNEYISKLCLLYGYNGSGKSNLINALKYILYSNNGYITSSDDSIKKLLDPNMIYGKNDKSRFCLEFYSNDECILYLYELVLDNQNKKIYSEKLAKNNDTIIFKRELNSIKEGIFHYNKYIPDTNTFLSFINDEKIDEYREEVNYYLSLFKNLCFLFPFTNEADFSSYAIVEAFEYFNKYNIWDIYKKLLSLIDIDDLSIENAVSRNEFSFIIDNKRLVTKHDSYTNDFDEVESEGSKVYAINLIYILVSLINGTLSIVDEFNGIQSELLEFIINLFGDNFFDSIKDIAPDTSQLILSTHDSSLMSIDGTILYNYFIVNKENNISSIYRTDYLSLRNNNLNIDNLEKEYRKNRLGLSKKEINLNN
ncbi:abortive infection protein [Brachyspira hampsonii]|uniref:Abortive infection protein n=1 Tax=Brachyspira hampsonii TaxID=1287055 RepID=A0AAC9TTT2_9SPIR|nr:AAA family ATPase [Brachyspira hampsonii]ASJ21353.1 abortive infection protein [Brachyspira hampsonii]MBW5379418.1 abortive infection protein [Brachyspira hampsonii]OEJ17190.1 abortive infection protein [Brachyspira hampsonii]